jgi:uncharacterized protein
MDEDLHDPLGGRAQRGRGPSERAAGPTPASPEGVLEPPVGDMPVSQEGRSASAAQIALEAPMGPPANDWPVWTGFVVLLAALVLAAVGGLIVDIPALLLGAKISSKHTPPGIALADTIVQDVAFVLTALLFAQFGGRTVRSWQFGLRPTPIRRAVGLTLGTTFLFLIFGAIWVTLFKVSEDKKLLEQLGANETTVLLVLGALLTTVIAPICEEILFRGYIFAALSKWRGWLPAAAMTGVLFGAVHVGSAPALDLVPLGVLGFMLCVLYRRTGSLYPCIAVHSLNNSLAFAELEKWGWQLPVLIAAALATIALLGLIFRALGAISEPPQAPAVIATTYDSP